MRAHMTSLVVLTLLASACLAADADTTRTEIPGLTVSGQALPWGDGPLPVGFIDRHDGGHLGEMLENLPGVWMVRRAASGTEPVIRGLGSERVQTRLGAVPLYGACPGHMDPPVTYLNGSSAQSLTLTRRAGAASGSGGLAGTVLVDPDYERAAGTAAGWSPFLDAGYGSARSGYRVGAGLSGGTEDLDLRFGVGARKLEDYDAPDGRTVPAGLTSRHADLSLGWRPAQGHRLWTAWNFVHEEDVDYPALPMDNRDTDFVAGNLGWRLDHDRTTLRMTAGLSAVDHLMDNRDKANRMMMAAETDAEVRTWAVRGELEHRAGFGRLSAGVDVTGVDKDALRTRLIMADSSVFRDHMWPDAVQVTGGGWARLDKPLGGTLKLAAEARVDMVDSRARAADDPSLGGWTVREQYQRFYGDEAGETDLSETLGQGSLRLEGEVAGRAVWHVRTGMAGRAAGITERYSAFGPAPGGFLVGNPTLAPEKAWQSEVGVDLGGERLALGLAVHHSRIDDYILPTVVDRRDVNGDGNDDTIKGFLNRDATLTGAEMALEYRPGPRILVPASLAYVRGRNTSDDRDLPEIPAFSGAAEVRWLAHADQDVWLLGGARFAADQAKIDPMFGEDRTGGWTVWHAGLEAHPLDGLRIRATVENIFDRLYNDHLTREAVLPTGGLAAGDEVPATGRSLEISARWVF